MTASFELFDHTADIGFRLRADTLPELLTIAANALYAVIGELATKPPTRRERLTIEGKDQSLVLFDFLNHALILFERDRRRIVKLEDVLSGPEKLDMGLQTANIDPQNSALDREVKAITYHGLELNEIRRDNQPAYYEATVIVDI